AVADNFCGYALLQLYFTMGMIDNHQVGVTVAIDEAGRDDFTLNINNSPSLLINASDGDDETILYANVAVIPRIAAAIHDSAVFQNKIEHASILSFALFEHSARCYGSF